MHLSLLTKTTFVIITFVVASMFISDLIFPAHASTNGAPAGRTGSPGDVFSCTACHAGTAATIPGLITSNIPASGYIPGQTYTITGSITSIGKTKFGFQISPQDTLGNPLGALVITDPTNTKLVGTTGNYVTHLTAGTSFPSGIATWSFDWVAPIAGTGDVTFYGAFNITNNNSISSGDVIKLSSLSIQENLSASINNFTLNQEDWNVYPNPFKDMVFLSNKNGSKIQHVSITDVSGKFILKIEDFSKDQKLDLTSLSTGLYILNVCTEKGTTITKIVKK